jgi:methylsterol monooxygenase
LNLEVTRDLPSFVLTMRDLIFCLVCQEIFFYYTHRLLHHRLFYWLHKQHHEIKTPSSITAKYSRFLEHALANVFSAFIGFKIAKCHISTAYLWITTVLVTTLHDHSGEFSLLNWFKNNSELSFISGHHFFFLHSSQMHDFHHRT